MIRSSVLRQIGALFGTQPDDDVVRSTPNTVRSLRVQLAHALRAARPEDGEALEQLQKALQEESPSAADSPIHADIANLLLAQRDRPGAFMAYIRAVTAAPAGADRAARSALRLLDEEEVAGFAINMPHEDVTALSAAVRACSAPSPSVCLLSARLSRERGEVGTAIDTLRQLADQKRRTNPAIYTELARTLVDDGRPAEALAYLERIRADRSPARSTVRAWALLDLGRFEEALSVADGVGAEDPAAPIVRALALYGAGKPDQALEAVGAAGPTRDRALVEALVGLQKASEFNTVLDATTINAANAAAISAARLDPANPHVLLVRAQIDLEGCIDVDEGRRLLKSALEHKTDLLQRSRWFGIQERRRALNDWFQYFRVELAAAQGDGAGVLERAADVDRSYTTYAHDAALDTLVANEYLRRGDLAQAAASFSKAAISFEASGNYQRAVAATRSRIEAERSAAALVSLAEYLWQASHDASWSTDQIERAIDEGLETLAAAEGTLPAELVPREAVLRGLLLYRRAEIASSGEARASWAAVPWLLLAAILRPSEPIWSAHVAWALDHADAQRAALYFAERAFALDTKTRYVQETLLTMHLNYHGELDAQTLAVADEYTGDTAWRDSVLLMARMLSHDLEGLDRLARADLFDAPWVRDAQARITVLMAGVEAAREQLEDVRAEAQRPPKDYGSASDMSLLLGERDVARRLILMGQESGEMTERDVAYNLAFVDLVTSGSQEAEDAIAARLRQRTLPRHVRSAANVELPLLTFIPECPPQVAAAADRLIAVARQRLDELAQLPALASDLADAPPDSHALLAGLLELAELVDRAAWPAASDLAKRLADEHTDGVVGLALRQVDADSRARVDSPSDTALPAAGNTGG